MSEIAEQARWAAPLKSEIPRVIADQLARLLAGVAHGDFVAARGDAGRTIAC